MVLKVRLLEEVVEVEAVGGASVDAAREVVVGRLIGVVSVVDNDLEGRVVFPIDFMICADLTGRTTASRGVIGGKSALRTAWNEM